jgi:beta-lactamase regulating signal transducer with metallopeptidase domain
VEALLSFFAQNTLGALILALCIYAVTRVWRNPPVVHVLWLLVLIKLAAPPLVGVYWQSFTQLSQSVAPARVDPRPSHVASDRMPTADVTSESTPPHKLPNAERPRQLVHTESAIIATEERHKNETAFSWPRASRFVFWIWLAGTAVAATVAATRVIRLLRCIRNTLPASPRLQAIAREVGKRFGVRQPHDVRYVDSGGPLVFCLGGRATILLPIDLFRRLDDEQASMILAHEMAHLCRCDHWIRLFELGVCSLYWWNPLVWFVRRQIHCAEEQCCDAWVRWAFPASAKRYAEVLLLASDSGGSRGTASPLLASSFLRRHSLKARIEMILKSRFAPRLSLRGKAVLCLFAIVALPLFAQSTASHAQQRADYAEPTKGGPSAQPRSALSPVALRAAFAAKYPRVPERPSEADFPLVVHFEQGASKLLPGDRIDITEVRGTATTMTPGNVYWIKGTYTLTSHDRANLTINVTAAIASEGTGSTLKTQSVEVTKGIGTFTLLYSMICKGWPHVSFYPAAEGGSDFGGTYFGTGEFVLKQWWGEGRNVSHNAKSEAAPLGLAPLLVVRNGTSTSDFPDAVRFELGETRFLSGDGITITEVRGTAEEIALGQIYCIKGRYRLASHDRAQLSVGITADNAADGTKSGFKPQDTIVDKGDGTFMLFLPMAYKGWPHVSFYPAEGGDGFGGVYFGTGDSVAKPKIETSSSATNQDSQLEGPPPNLLPVEAAENALARRLWDTLGLRFRKMAIKSAPTSQFPYEGALVISEVRGGSPASLGKIQKEDGLIGIDNYATLSAGNVLWIVNHRPKDETGTAKLRLLIFRDNEPRHVELVLPRLAPRAERVAE